LTESIPVGSGEKESNKKEVKIILNPIKKEYFNL